ncbi:hypothetical protein Pmani_033614 [Petrolisthes manimaculis]|uniref:PH domain-containing protein n=1 Tax=Petrolisthes manimaculis TaxID=1843537 RepID=A0AAE1NRJ5_9EUCA|nr:hypothetical protein Pmani_033614 [Petrolisthes manimaculis]
MLTCGETREIEVSCGEAEGVRRDGGGGGDSGSGYLGAVDITQNSKHCHIRLQHGVLSVTISGCGEIKMPQRTMALVQTVPLHPSWLLLLGRLSQCPLRLGERAVRAAVVIEFEYKDDLEALMARMKKDNGSTPRPGLPSTPTITQPIPTSTRLQYNQTPLPQHNQSPLLQHTSLTKPAIPPHPSLRHNSPRVVRQESNNGYLDMTVKASILNSNLHDSPQQPYANCLPVSDSSVRQCNEIIKNVIESEDEHISKLEGIKRSLANSQNNLALMETVNKAYDFHRLVLRREMNRMHTARQLAESFVNCSEIFKIYKDLLQDYSKSFHRPSTSSNIEDFLLLITKLQYYEDVFSFLLKQATSSYMFRQALMAIKIPLDAVNSHLIFDRVDVCPISRHHHGPALRFGWIQLTDRAPRGIGMVFAILTETHLIFTFKSLKQERLTYTSDIKLKSASFWVKENCMTIEDTRRDGGQRRIYNLHINTDLEFGAWESSIRDAMQKQTQTENTKHYTEC